MTPAVLGTIAVLLGMAVTGQTPNQAFSAALGDIQANIAPAKRPYARYLSLAGIPEANRPKFLQALSFSLNSTHFQKQILPLTVVNGFLVRLDLTEFGWDKENRQEEIDRLAGDGVKFDFKGNATALARFVDIWEDIARIEPYHAFSKDLDSPKGVRGWIDPALAAEAAKVSYSEKFVVAAWWLYPRLWVEAADGGFYSQLLLFPTSEQQLYKRLGIDIRNIEQRRGIQGAAVVGPSIVAIHPREVQEFASPVGPTRTCWRTKDFKIDWGTQFDEAGVDIKNVTEALANTAKHDGREMIGSLPDGLHFYYLSDGNGKQANVVPQDIAIDMRQERPDRDPNVRNAYKCVSCHGPLDGIYPFRDNVKGVILSDRGVALEAYDKGYDRRKLLTRKKDIEEFYLPGLNNRVAEQQASYRFHVFTATGMDGNENSRNVVGTFDRYFWDLVTPEAAAHEMGLPLLEAEEYWRHSVDLRRSVPEKNYYVPNQNLIRLAAGESVRRSGWESAVGDAMRGRPGGYLWETQVKAVQQVIKVPAPPPPVYAPPTGYYPR